MGSARTLFVSSFAPVFENGRALRTYAVIRALAAHGPLDVAYVPFPRAEPSPAFSAIDGVDYHLIQPSRGARRLAHHALLRATGLPGPVARSASPELVGEATRRAAERGRGVVVAGDFGTAAALLGLARRRPVVYNSHNVESSYVSSDEVPRGYMALLRRAERKVLATAAESWMVSPRDVELARELAPAARLRYAPNVVDVARIDRVPAGTGGGGVVLLVADFLYGPNVVSAQWLLEEVLPLVWAQLPEARVRIVGRASERIAGAGDARVERPGFVEDLRAEYVGAAAVAVPLLVGGGTPLKFIEALAYGVPVVSTGVATRGLAVEDRVHFRRGDDAAAFAAGLVDLLRHGDAEMTARARGLVEAEYSVEALVRLLAPALQGPPAPG